PAMPVVVKSERLLGRQRQHRVPPFGRSDQSGATTRMQADTEESRAPKKAARRIPAIRLLWIEDLPPAPAIVCEGRPLPVHYHPQAGEQIVAGHFVLFA